MCRLYGFRANEPTKVECTLVHAQNALIVQSREDKAGLSHGHGWGVATYGDTIPDVERLEWAAYHGEHFRRAAARVYSETVLAHVRRATVGETSLANTHPFFAGPWAFAHNGTIPRFDEVRPRMLDAITAEHRAAIKGTTDSEHLFRLILSRMDDESNRPTVEIVRDAVLDIVAWGREIDMQAHFGLNTLLTDGDELVGTRWGRTLFYVQRDGIRDCEICGFPHVHHDPATDYRAVVIASEPITHETWIEVPERSVFSVPPGLSIDIEPLERARSALSA